MIKYTNFRVVERPIYTKAETILGTHSLIKIKNYVISFIEKKTNERTNERKRVHRSEKEWFILIFFLLKPLYVSLSRSDPKSEQRLK